VHTRPVTVGRRAPTCPIWWPGAEGSSAERADQPPWDGDRCQRPVQDCRA
jgi:hypothetical protein